MSATARYTFRLLCISPSSRTRPVLHYGSLLGELATSPDAVAAGIKIPYPGWVEQFGGTGTVIQTLIPFPQYSDIYNTYETDGTAFYNGLQMQGEKRFSGGLSYLADLTLSRNIANESVGSTLFNPTPSIRLICRRSLRRLRSTRSTL